MSNKKIGISIVVAVILQIALITLLAMNVSTDNYSDRRVGIFITGLPLIPLIIFIGYCVSRTKGITEFIDKHRIITAILVSAVLYILSILMYINGLFLNR